MSLWDRPSHLLGRAEVPSSLRSLLPTPAPLIPPAAEPQPRHTAAIHTQFNGLLSLASVSRVLFPLGQFLALNLRDP